MISRFSLAYRSTRLPFRPVRGSLSMASPRPFSSEGPHRDKKQWRLQELLSLHDETFIYQLERFCHYYQIPYLENNVQKSIENATKIYYKLLDDQQNIPEQFSWIIDHLRTIPRTSIEDSENPFLMRERWMKFFVGGQSPILINQDRALKNNLDNVLLYDNSRSK